MPKIFMLLFAIAITFETPLYAQDIVVVTEEYPPYNFTLNGKVTGYSTEIVKEVLKRAGLSYSIRSYPWARTYNMALEMPNVLIYSIGRSEKRESLFKWVDIVAPYDIYLYKLKKRTDISVKNLDDTKKYIIGAVRHDVRAQYLEKMGFTPDKNLDLVANDLQNIKKLFHQRIDFFPIDSLGLTYVMKQNDMNVEELEQVLYLEDLSAGLYLAYSLQTDDTIIEKTKAALAEIKQDGTFNAILKKYVQ